MGDRLQETKRRAWSSYIGSLLLIMCLFGTSNVFSVYLGGICEWMRATPTQAALFFTIYSAVMVVLNLFISAFIGKVPTKLLALIGAVSYLVCFLCIGLSHNLIMLYVGSFFFGISVVLNGYSICQPAVSWWHVTNVGKKISGLSVSYAISSAVISALVGRALTAIGFQSTFLLNGCILGAIMIFSAVFLINDPPEKYGLKPLGYKDETEHILSQQTEPQTAGGMTVSEIFRTVPFWGVLICVFVASVFIMGFLYNAAAIFQNFGLEAVAAADMISIYSIAGIFWIFLYGSIADKWGISKANLIFGVCTAVSFAIAVFATGKTAALVMAVIIASCNYIGMINALSMGAIYGSKSIGTLVALGMVANGAATALGTPLCSFMYEQFGNYNMFMGVGTVAVIITTLGFTYFTSPSVIKKVNS